MFVFKYLGKTVLLFFFFFGWMMDLVFITLYLAVYLNWSYDMNTVFCSMLNFYKFFSVVILGVTFQER